MLRVDQVEDVLYPVSLYAKTKVKMEVDMTHLGARHFGYVLGNL